MSVFLARISIQKEEPNSIFKYVCSVKKDIHIPKVEGVSMAIVQEASTPDVEWGVYLINHKKEALQNIIVVSKGYGIINEEEIQTSSLRHFFDELEAESFQKIEKIMPDVFGLNNEYRLTFYMNQVLHDRKYVFVPDSVTDANLVSVPLVNLPGVLIK